MAFRSNTAPATNNTNAAQNDAWKASGFINLYLPSSDGKRKKLGAIPLKLNKPSEAALLEWLKADPSNAAKLLSKLEIDFQNVEASQAIGFALE